MAVKLQKIHNTPAKPKQIFFIMINKSDILDISHKTNNILIFNGLLFIKRPFIRIFAKSINHRLTQRDTLTENIGL